MQYMQHSPGGRGVELCRVSTNACMHMLCVLETIDQLAADLARLCMAGINRVCTPWHGVLYARCPCCHVLSFTEKKVAQVQVALGYLG